MQRRILDEVLEPLFGTGNISLMDVDDTTTTNRPTTSILDTAIGTTNDIEKGPSQQNSVIKTGQKPKSYGTIQENESDQPDSSTATKAKDSASTKSTTSVQKKRLIDPESIKPSRPTYNACLYMFHLLEGIAITAALALLVTQIMPFILLHLVRTDPSTLQQQQQQQATTTNNNNNTLTSNVLTIALRIYITLFCCLFIMTELGTSLVHKTLPLLQHYGSRGFLYSFLGLICAEEAYSERIKETLSLSYANGATNIQHIGWASIFMEVSSWFMLGIGIVYMLLGMCCCKRVRDHYKEKEINAWKQYRQDIQTWNRQYA